jgi:HNH endonuclease
MRGRKARKKQASLQVEYVDYAKVLEAKGMTCGLCGQAITKPLGRQDGQLCFDHIMPLDQGGQHTFDNLQPAHGDCHRRKVGKPENPQRNHQFAYDKPTSLLSRSTPEGFPEAGQSAYPAPTITETTAETTPETSLEITTNVGNGATTRLETKRQLRLTPRQQDAVEELENQLDTHSRGAFCVLVSDRGLGEERALSLLREAMELEDAGMIKTSLSRCFMDLCQRDAERQGIDLGFQRPGAP